MVWQILGQDAGWTNVGKLQGLRMIVSTVVCGQGIIAAVQPQDAWSACHLSCNLQSVIPSVYMYDNLPITGLLLRTY